MPETPAPVVSVVLPVRDAVRTLPIALESILTQTYTAFELIAVDDGSSDGSAEILAEAAVRDARVRVISTGGVGLTIALNRGIAAARGRYIARQDADDRSLPQRLARQVEMLDRQPALSALGTAAAVIDDAGNVVGRFPMRHGAAAVRAALRTGRATPVHGAMVIRRDGLDAAGGYREAFVTSQDFDLWLRLTDRGAIDNLDEPLYEWRLSEASVYGRRRQLQLRYAGLALAFTAERVRFGADSYEALVDARGDLDAFAGRYRLRGLLYGLWGELLLRGTSDAHAARPLLRRALGCRRLHPRTLFFWAWTELGLPWRRPLRPATR